MFAEQRRVCPDAVFAQHGSRFATSLIYEAVRAGRVPCLRVGRHIRFTRHMLEEWLAEQTKP